MYDKEKQRLIENDRRDDNLNRLIPSENQFANLTEFINNVDIAIQNVSMALDSQSASKDEIIDNRDYYDKEKKLSDFELYLIKFIVAYELHERIIYLSDIFPCPPSSILRPYCDRIFACTKRDGSKFEYFVDFRFVVDEPLGDDYPKYFKGGWSLKLNDNKSESETLTAMQPVNTQATPMEKQINPIIWTGDKVLLGYMIQWLKDNGLISQKTGRDSAIEGHFVDEKNNPIKNIKQGLSRVKSLNDGGLPKSYEKIEPMLKGLKPNKSKP